MSTTVPFPLVRIEWVDSFGCQTDWSPLDNVKDVRHACVSVGYLVEDGQHVKVVVPHISPGNDEIGADPQGSGDMAIPAVSILSIETIG